MLIGYLLPSAVKSVNEIIFSYKIIFLLYFKAIEVLKKWNLKKKLDLKKTKFKNNRYYHDYLNIILIIFTRFQQ